MNSNQKEKFTLTQTAIDRLTHAAQGNYLAHAYAIMEGHAAEATVSALRNAIRETGAFTLGNEPLGAGYKAAAVTAVNGVPFADDSAKAEFVAQAIVQAKAEHAARVAADRAKRAAAKKAEAEKAEAEKAAAEASPLSVRLTAKRNELLAWIADAQNKVDALNVEIAAAEKAAAAAAEKAAADKKAEDDRILASAQAILAARGVTPETTPLFSAVNEVVMESGIEAQREARRARKADKKVAIPA